MIEFDPIILQSFCDSSRTFMDYLLNYEFVKAFSCEYISAVGFFVFGTLLYTGVTVPIYIRTGSIMIPVVLLLIVGGVVMTQVAPPFTAIAAIVLVVAGAGLITYLFREFSP